MKNDEFWKVRIKNPTCYYFDFYYLMFWYNSSKIYIRKYLKQFSTENYKWKPCIRLESWTLSVRSTNN